MDFFYVASLNFKDPIDGVIGLARPNATMYLNPQLTPTEKRYFLGELDLTERKFSTRFERN